MQTQEMRAAKFLDNCYYLDGERKCYFFIKMLEKFRGNYIQNLIKLGVYQQLFGSILNKEEYLGFCNTIQQTDIAEINCVIARFKLFEIVNKFNNEIIDLSFLFTQNDDVINRAERHIIKHIVNIKKQIDEAVKPKTPTLKKVIKKKKDEWER